jgi:hypothetical protein
VGAETFKAKVRKKKKEGRLLQLKSLNQHQLKKSGTNCETSTDGQRILASPLAKKIASDKDSIDSS